MDDLNFKTNYMIFKDIVEQNVLDETNICYRN